MAKPNALDCYNRVVAERMPIIDSAPYDDGENTTDFSLFLPLSDDGEKVNMIMVFSTNHPSKPSFTTRS